MTDSSTTAEQLERGELLAYPTAPFPIPNDAQLEFLRGQQPVGRGHKDISFDPTTGRLTGVRVPTMELAPILNEFSIAATAWLGREFPGYAAGLVRDRVTLRTEEEATRPLRLTARNDLLHIDHFPTRPALGRRILRLCVHINPSEPRVWATSERFPELLNRYLARHRLPDRSLDGWAGPTQSVARLFGGRAGLSPYDALMQKLHHFLKEDTSFQVWGPRKLWTFAPAATWLLFTDGVAHAQLRGRYSLEHSWFVPVECLTVPDEAPIRVLARLGAEARRAG